MAEGFSKSRFGLFAKAGAVIYSIVAIWWASMLCLPPAKHVQHDQFDAVVVQPAGWHRVKHDDSSLDAAWLRNVPCNIDRVSWPGDVTSLSFFKDYVKPGRPALVRGIVDSEWPAFWRWTPQYLQERLSSLHVDQIRTVSRNGQASRNGTLTRLLASNGSEVAFDSEVLQTQGSLRHDVHTHFPLLKHFSKDTRLILSIGGTGSGIVFHKHQETFFALIAGAKRWLLYNESGKDALLRRYGDGGDSKHSSVGLSLETDLNPKPDSARKLDPHLTEESSANSETLSNPLRRWISHDLPQAAPQPMQCVQQPGELLYLPLNMLHATFNVGDTVGVAGRHAGRPAFLLEADASAEEFGELQLLCRTSPHRLATLC